ncbi:MAG: hypothetical protein KKC79_01705 [Gammaproteobacteria bacterium]|nr:hypothetical protein [Gammaproteobacteria bacterium]
MSKYNGDTNRIWKINGEYVRGVGSFHKTLPHNEYGEVEPAAFAALVSSTRGDGSEFAQIPMGSPRPITIPVDEGKLAFAAAFTNPQAGRATDPLTHAPHDYVMPPAPSVMSNTTAAEMVELYWMAILRDETVGQFDGSAGPSPLVTTAVDEINQRFQQAVDSSFITNAGTIENPAPPNNDGPDDRFILGTDIPGSAVAFKPFTPRTLFRLGFPGDEVGPLISQFFLRPATYGTQTIDQRQRPYKEAINYLTDVTDWLSAQNSGCDAAGQSYGKSNEDGATRYESNDRYIATMRDLARFVNKDALHQAYFNGALILLSGGAKWPQGNPYHDMGNGIVKGELADREAAFGVLGGPHILALVSEVATRALKVVWNQKWQVNLRRRPRAHAKSRCWRGQA